MEPALRRQMVGPGQEAELTPPAECDLLRRITTTQSTTICHTTSSWIFPSAAKTIRKLSTSSNPVSATIWPAVSDGQCFHGQCFNGDRLAATISAGTVSAITFSGQRRDIVTNMGWPLDTVGTSREPQHTSSSIRSDRARLGSETDLISSEASEANSNHESEYQSCRHAAADHTSDSCSLSGRTSRFHASIIDARAPGGGGFRR